MYIMGRWLHTISITETILFSLKKAGNGILCIHIYKRVKFSITMISVTYEKKKKKEEQRETCTNKRDSVRKI